MMEIRSILFWDEANHIPVAGYKIVDFRVSKDDVFAGFGIQGDLEKFSQMVTMLLQLIDKEVILKGYFLYSKGREWQKITNAFELKELKYVTAIVGTIYFKDPNDLLIFKLEQ